VKQNKKAKICFVIYIAGFFFLKFFCYEVIVKQKIYKRPSNYYLRAGRGSGELVPCSRGIADGNWRRACGLSITKPVEPPPPPVHWSMISPCVTGTPFLFQVLSSRLTVISLVVTVYLPTQTSPSGCGSKILTLRHVAVTEAGREKGGRGKRGGIGVPHDNTPVLAGVRRVEFEGESTDLLAQSRVR
jgi:hypothetical protein